MGYRRLFIMRKDLNMSVGKLLAQTCHCAEAYWTNGLRQHCKLIEDESVYSCNITISREIFEQYINNSFTKTICAAKNKNHLLKAKIIAEELGLEENVHFGMIYDNCLTELEPEEENGTTLTGIWFSPLNDEITHTISKKYQLYR